MAKKKPRKRFMRAGGGSRDITQIRQNGKRVSGAAARTRKGKLRANLTLHLRGGRKLITGGGGE